MPPPPPHLGPILVVSTLDALTKCISHVHSAGQLCLDIEALRPPVDTPHILGKISTVQLHAVHRGTMIARDGPTKEPTYVIDMLALQREGGRARDLLKEMLEREHQMKLLYDMRGDFRALQTQMDITLPRVPTVDVQLMQVAQRWVEHGSNHRFTLSAALRDSCGFSEEEVSNMLMMKQAFRDKADIWEERPLTQSVLEYAASGAALLPMLWAKLAPFHDNGKTLSRRVRAQLLSNAASPEEELGIVNKEWLWEVVGPPGKCAKCGVSGHSPDVCKRTHCDFCGQSGHTIEACSLKLKADALRDAAGKPQHKKVLICGFCNAEGHDEDHCFKKNPPKCANCGERGHTIRSCRKLVPCWKCGKTGHTPQNCTQTSKDLSRVNRS